MSKDREEAVKILRLVQKHRPDLIPADATIRLATDDEERFRATDAVIQKADGTVIQVGYRRQRDKGASASSVK